MSPAISPADCYANVTPRRHDFADREGYYFFAGKGYAVRNNGSGDARESDLVFINERPFAVLEWAQTGAAMVTVELDPAKLRAADPGGSVYEYADTLVDPR